MYNNPTNKYYIEHTDIDDFAREVQRNHVLVTLIFHFMEVKLLL